MKLIVVCADQLSINYIIKLKAKTSQKQWKYIKLPQVSFFKILSRMYLNARLHRQQGCSVKKNSLISIWIKSLWCDSENWKYNTLLSIYNADAFPLLSLMDLKVLSLNTPHILLHKTLDTFHRNETLARSVL